MSRVSAMHAVSPLVAMPVRMVRIEKALSNDPAQRATLDGAGGLEFRIAGTAANSGVVASRLDVAFDRHKVSVPLSTGQTPVETLKKLQALMPAGYQAVCLRTWRHPGADVIVGVRISPSAGRRSLTARRTPG